MTPSLRQFMSISIVGMTILLLSLLYFHLELSRDYLEVHLDTHNKNLAIVLRNSLLVEGLEKELINNQDKLSESLRRRITATLEQELRWVPVFKVKVYSKDSMVIYSTKQDEIGDSAKLNEAVQGALSGKAISGLVHRNELNEFDNLVEGLSLHQQYIPIENQQNGEILGAFEIYTNISGILTDVGRKQEIIFWSIGGILLMFYIGLAVSFLATHRLLRRETGQRQKHLHELQVIHRELEQRVAERTAQLDKSNHFLQSVIDGIGDPLLVIRPDFTIALMNNAAERLIPPGQPAENYRYCYQVSHRRSEPCTDPDHPCSFKQVMESGGTMRVRHTHYDADNQPILVDLVSTPLYSENGEFEGVIEVEHDITQMVQIQAGLAQSEARLQSIMSIVPEAILTCDSNYVIESINTSAQSLFNDRENNLVGANWHDFFSDSPKPIQYEPENRGHKVTVLKRFDGEEFPADIWTGPLELADGFTSYIVVIRDITEQLQAREELEATRQQYFHQEKMAAIGQLAAGILHEVGNPIAAIAGAASEMKTMTDCGVLIAGACPLDDAVNRNIKLIDEQTTRLGNITREIADFASPRPRQRELLDLNSLLKSTAQILTYDQRFRAKKMDIQLDRNLPAIVGVADQLTQVFMNLIINAMDASNSVEKRDYHILIKSELREDGVLVIVQDYGEGMSEETLGHALEPFYTTKPLGKGTGLGLSLCNTIVLAHGGVMEIESEEMKGTTVRVYLPVDISAQEASSDGTD